MTHTDPWEVHAGWWQEGFTDGADPEYTEQILPMAAAHLAGAEDVLDVGAGEGQVSRLAAAVGARLVVGVDPSWAQLSTATARGGGARYARAAASSLPFPSASFDAAVACLVFEHIDDADEALSEVGRVLRPGAGSCSSSTTRSCRRRGRVGSTTRSSASSTGGWGRTCPRTG